MSLRNALVCALLLLAPALSAAPLTQWSAPEGNDHYYQLFLRADFINWTDASNNAQSLGGYLATITSEAENDFITALTAGIESWIGLTDEATEGTFLWVTGEPLDYTNWADAEPNNDPRFDGEDYAIINPERVPASFWNDLPNNPARVTAWLVEWDEQPLLATPEPSTLWMLAVGAWFIWRRSSS